MHCWEAMDFIWDIAVVIWLLALCMIMKKRRFIQSLCFCVCPHKEAMLAN
jgi:hypothetical protein